MLCELQWPSGLDTEAVIRLADPTSSAQHCQIVLMSYHGARPHCHTMVSDHDVTSWCQTIVSDQDMELG